MNGKHLLDTNIIIAFINNESTVVESFRKSDGLFLPVVALGELFFGAHKSMRVQDNLDQIHRVMRHIPVKDCNDDTAQEYGRIKNQLRGDGSPIPENDIWVAAIAKQHEMTLVTRDAHFQSVTDLSTETW